MNLLAVCLLLLAVAEAMAGMRKIRMPKSLKPKVGHFEKGKPFTLDLYVERGHIKRPKGMAAKIRSARARMRAVAAAKSKGGWLSRLRGSLRRTKPKDAKTATQSRKRRFGIFGKEMIEAFNATAEEYARQDFEMMPDEEEASGQHPNETIHDEVQSRVFGGLFFKYGPEILRPMVHLTVNGKRYKMMFDTGSTMSMVPQAGCISDPLLNFFCFLDPLFDPPANDNPAMLPDHRQGYLGHLGDSTFVGFTGKVRDVIITLGNRQLHGRLTTANWISEIEYPMMGASPAMNEPNLPYEILRQMGEPRKWFTVLITPRDTTTWNTPSGIVVFGDIDRRRCSPHITWMGDQTSSDLGLFEPGLIMWTAVLESIWIDNQMLRQQYSANVPMYGKTDTGGPSFIFITEAYNALIAYLGLTPRQGRHTLSCSTRFTITLKVRNGDNSEHLSIRVHSQHLLWKNGLDAPNDCTLLIEDGGANSFFTFGFALFRSVCVVHDYDNFRMGFAPFQIPPPAPAPAPAPIPNSQP